MSDGISETVDRVRAVLEGETDGTLLYGRGMKTDGWRHSLTVGDLRALIAAYESAVREREVQVDMTLSQQVIAERAIAQRDRARAALERQARLADDFNGNPSYSALEGQGFTVLRNLALAALTEDA